MGMKASLYDDLNNSMSIFINKLLFDTTHSSTQNLQVRMYITAFILLLYSVLLSFFVFFTRDAQNHKMLWKYCDLSRTGQSDDKEKCKGKVADKYIYIKKKVKKYLNSNSTVYTIIVRITVSHQNTLGPSPKEATSAYHKFYLNCRTGSHRSLVMTRVHV